MDQMYLYDEQGIGIILDLFHKNRGFYLMKSKGFSSTMMPPLNTHYTSAWKDIRCASISLGSSLTLVVNIIFYKLKINSLITRSCASTYKNKFSKMQYIFRYILESYVICAIIRKYLILLKYQRKTSVIMILFPLSGSKTRVIMILFTLSGFLNQYIRIIGLEMA